MANRYIKQKMAKQRVTNRNAFKAIFCNIAIITMVFFVIICCTPSTEHHDEPDIVVTNPIVNNEVQQPDDMEDDSTIDTNKLTNTTADMNNLSNVTNVSLINDKDAYLLAKIAMAEAEGCSTHVKALVILVVMNRVMSNEFPDTVEEVIFQERNGVYQFTPIGNGRWDRVEPNKDCWDALEVVFSEKYDFSDGALYFESMKNPDNWHSRNLEFICEYEGVRFYK